ncbi:hypothetical protein [Pseudoalteromonas sp. L21]|uniref:hypothetical protein n=1 Tax=Pseudoalteromonas sp. L21 TaxID=1539746 RepID=UPI001F39BD6E|nr:hypothetical protein [Pseudoalteromonas sp. L21]MCF7516611.1 hypothetical protein [Pseudoalteromonas sp. L21]
MKSNLLSFIFLGMLFFSKDAFSHDLICNKKNTCTPEEVENALSQAWNAVKVEDKVLNIKSDIVVDGVVSFNGNRNGALTINGNNHRVTLKGMRLINMPNLSVKNLTFIGGGEPPVYDELIYVGSNAQHISNGLFENVNIIDSPRDALVISRFNGFTYRKGKIENAGVSNVFYDERHYGSGIQAYNTNQLTIGGSVNDKVTFSKIPLKALYVGGIENQPISVSNVNISYNEFQLFREDNDSRHIYGKCAGVAIYISQDPDYEDSNFISDFKISNNNISGVSYNGIRINGRNHIVKNNVIDYRGSNNCNAKVGSHAIKSYDLLDSEITSNTIYNAGSGIVQNSSGPEGGKGVIQGNVISSNIIESNDIGIEIVGSGPIADNTITLNSIKNALNQGVILHSDKPETGARNKIINNAIVSYSSYENSVISIKNNTDLYFERQWVRGDTPAGKYFIDLSGVTNSRFVESTFLSKQLYGNQTVLFLNNLSLNNVVNGFEITSSSICYDDRGNNNILAKCKKL